jgi:hypothetical protein
LIKTWKLFPGLGDQLAFPEASRLLVFRVETESGELGPFGMADPRQHPRVCRIRNLLGPEPLKPLAEVRDCNYGVYRAACSPDGKYYAVEGLAGSPGRFTRIANLYDGLTGKKLGPLPTEHPIQTDQASFWFDLTGSILFYVYRFGDQPGAFFLKVPSLAVSQRLDRLPVALGPLGKRWLLRSSSSGEDGQQAAWLTLFEQDRPERLVQFVLDVGSSFIMIGNPQFSPDGQHIFWGSPSGVTVVDLVEVNRRLSELGLGW